MSLPKITIIGLGNMGEALLSGILSAGLLEKEQITGVETFAPRAKQIAESHGIRVTGEVKEGVKGSGAVILAVKPPDAAAALDALGGEETPAVISICAGLTLDWLQKHAPKSQIVRVMPNTPALVGEGASAFCIADKASEEAARWAETILSAVGKAYRVKDEALMDAVTGLSGSGPAYVFLFIEALADAGVAAGLPREIAASLAMQTVKGAATMALEADVPTSVLKDRVCSPGGTTIQGVRTLEAMGLRSAVIEAVLAATQRSKELGG